MYGTRGSRRGHGGITWAPVGPSAAWRFPSLRGRFSDMHVLHVLGRVELVDGSGVAVRSVLSQPKRIALLSVLAADPGGSVSRDRLVEILWRESDTESGRHALNQALYFLRRSLGKRALLTDEGNRVRISPEHLRSDVHDFRARIAEGDLDGALDLYHGPLLQDFTLPDHPDFERWMDEARSRLDGQARDAALAAAREALARGDPAVACQRAEFACRLAPLEERPLRQLLKALDRAGDRARALASYREFQERLRSELGVEPSSTTAMLAVKISEAGEEAPPPANGVGRSVSPAGETAPAAGVRVPSTARSEGPERRTHRRWSRRVLGLGPVSLSAWSLAVILGLAWAFLGWNGAPGEPLDAAGTATGARVAVLPFSFQGSPAFEYLGPGVAELLNIGLGELQPLRTVDPLAVASALEEGGEASPITVRDADRVASRYDVDLYLMGSVIEFGGRIEIIVYLHQKGGELLTSLRKHISDETRLFQVVDDLVRELAAVEHLAVPSTLGRTAAMTTHSFPAFRSFLEGEELYRRGDYPGAHQAMEEAIDLDPSFALAYYRGAMSSLWMGTLDFDLARSWIQTGLDYAERLPDQEHRLMSALDAFLGGRPAEAERLYQEILSRQPENVEAWFSLGEVLFHNGPILGRSPSEAREAWERVLGVQPDHRGALFHLALTAAAEGEVDELVDILDRLTRLASDDRPSLAVDALAAWATGDREHQLRVLERSRHEPERALNWAVEYLARYLQELPGAVELAETRSGEESRESERIGAHTRLALLAIAQGRPGAAGEKASALDAMDPVEGAALRAYLQALPEIWLDLRAVTLSGGTVGGEDPPGARPARDLVPRLPAVEGEPAGAGPSGHPVPDRWPGAEDLRWYLGALGDGRSAGFPSGSPSLVHASEHLRDRSSEPHSLAPLLARALEAEGVRRTQDLATTLAAYGSLFSEPGVWYEMTRVSPFYSLVRERMILPELLREEGEWDEALAWLDLLPRSTLGEMPLLGASWVRAAEIHEARGHRQEAVAAYRKAIELWSDAEPEWDLVVDELEARVERLAQTTVAGGWEPIVSTNHESRGQP